MFREDSEEEVTLERDIEEEKEQALQNWVSVGNWKEAAGAAHAKVLR